MALESKPHQLAALLLHLLPALGDKLIDDVRAVRQFEADYAGSRVPHVTEISHSCGPLAIGRA